ncbi:MAG: hypothetical protein J1E64_07770 [Acetatifactor sp.]|nr:hypothetical protein [Acetatifactor sp.]
MSGNNNKRKNTGEEKIVTKYDLKMQRRREEKEREKRREKISTAVGAVIVVALICLVASFPLRNYLAVHGTYVEIGGEKISRVEYDYNFNYTLSSYVNSDEGMFSYYFGLDTSKDLSSQMYTDTLTWKDFFDEMTVENIKHNKALLREIEAEGFTYDTSEEFAAYEENIRADAKTAGVSVKEYVAQLYGEYATLSRISGYVKQNMLLNAYYDKVAEENAPSDEEIEAYYQENKDDYDVVDYRLLTFDAELPTEPTELADPVTGEAAGTTADYQPSDAEIDKAMEDAKALADAAEATVGTEGTLNEGASMLYTATALSDWLFDETRTAGDTAVIEDADNYRYYVVEFESRYRDETPTVDLRALVTATGNGQALLDSWAAGEATEESFAQLCREHSEDTNTAADGGLYEALADNGMDKTLSSWIYDSARQPGDTASISIEEGSDYVLYYIGTNNPTYKLEISSILLSNTIEEYMAQISKDLEVSDPKHNLNYLYVEAESSAGETGETESTESGEATQ